MDRIGSIARNVILGLIGFYVLYVILVGLLSNVTPRNYYPDTLDANATDRDRALVMARAVTFSLETELDSLFGWLPNDISQVQRIIDNKTEYQKGVIYATRPASDIVSSALARVGSRDTLDSRLFDASSRYFPYGEDVFGFWFVYNTEKNYREGIKNWYAWAESIGSGDKKAGIYNIQTNDIYNILKYCSDMLEYVLGNLNSSKLGHFDSDNIIYYSKGIASVVGNVLRGLSAVNDKFIDRGTEESLNEAIRRFEYIENFNPVYTVAGGSVEGDTMLPNHIASLARHFDVAKNRLDDILKAMAR